MHICQNNTGDYVKKEDYDKLMDIFLLCYSLVQGDLIDLHDCSKRHDAMKIKDFMLEVTDANK